MNKEVKVSWIGHQNPVMDVLGILREKNSRLYYAALVHLAGAFVMLLLMTIDDTQILGINRWIKPFKFFISVAIYLATFGWLSGDLPKTRFIRLFSSQVILAMIVEMIIVVVQAGRGVKSHFNADTPVGVILYSIMGLFILYNTFWVIAFTYRYWKSPLGHLSSAYVLSARLGLILFLLGSVLGGYMSSQTGHTVGAADGGPGVPLLNWSTASGDLRIAHFLGLHGIHFLFLLYFFLSSQRLEDTTKRAFVWLGFGLILTLTFWTYVQALQGSPFLRL